MAISKKDWIEKGTYPGGKPLNPKDKNIDKYYANYVKEVKGASSEKRKAIEKQHGISKADKKSSGGNGKEEAKKERDNGNGGDTAKKRSPASYRPDVPIAKGGDDVFFGTNIPTKGYS